MTRFKKVLLAGTASFALMATPALAIDGVGGVTGTTSGAANAGTSIGGETITGGAGGSIGADADVDANRDGVSGSGSAGTSSSGNVGDSGLSGSTGGSASGAIQTPSTAETESNVRGAAEAARDAAKGMTGGAGGGATGKGAVNSDTGAAGRISNDEEDEGASLRGNTVNETVAQVGSGTGGATDALGSGGSTAPADTGVTGTTGGSTDRIVGDEGAGSTAGSAGAAAGATGTAPEMDPTSRLTEMGYTNIEPSTSASGTAEGETSYTATNASGEPVEVVVDTRTGAVIRETGSTTVDTPSKDNP